MARCGRGAEASGASRCDGRKRATVRRHDRGECGSCGAFAGTAGGRAARAGRTGGAPRDCHAARCTAAWPRATRQCCRAGARGRGTGAPGSPGGRIAARNGGTVPGVRGIAAACHCGRDGAARAAARGPSAGHAAGDTGCESWLVRRARRPCRVDDSAGPGPGAPEAEPATARPARSPRAGQRRSGHRYLHGAQPAGARSARGCEPAAARAAGFAGIRERAGRCRPACFSRAAPPGAAL